MQKNNEYSSLLYKYKLKYEGINYGSLLELDIYRDNYKQYIKK